MLLDQDAVGPSSSLHTGLLAPSRHTPDILSLCLGTPDDEVPYPILEHVRSSIELIQEEVLRVTGAAEFADWDPLKNDPTLTTNTDWDPRASWDAIPLFFQNKWTDACVSFPLTCSVLQQGGELEMLCDTRRYADLVPPAILEQDYDEVRGALSRTFHRFDGFRSEPSSAHVSNVRASSQRARRKII